MLRIAIILMLGIGLSQIASTSDVKPMDNDLFQDLEEVTIATQKDVLKEIVEAFKESRTINEELIEEYNSAQSILDNK